MARDHKHSIADIRIYQLALSLEEQVYQLARTLPQQQFELANGLRRAGAAVAHYIYESHRRYSYNAKLEMLQGARLEAETARKLLADYHQAGFGKTGKLCEDYTILIKQSWGLSKWLKTKQLEQQTVIQAKSKDELVAARS